MLYTVILENLLLVLFVSFANARRGEGAVNDAMKVLKPPYPYRLLSVNEVKDTSFITTKQCVLIEYMDEEEKSSGLAYVSTRKSNPDAPWKMEMYRVTVDSKHKDILLYSNLDGGSLEHKYRVLHVAQNSCYIVEKVELQTPAAQITTPNKHKCELWGISDKDGFSTEEELQKSMESCAPFFKDLCEAKAKPYLKRSCKRI